MGLLSKTLLADALVPNNGVTQKMTMPQIDGFMGLMDVVNTLYCKPRRGWVMRDVRDPETIAEHSEDMAGMALVLAPKYESVIHPYDAAFMALTHDIVEAPKHAGDITPHDGVSPAEKKRREYQALEYIESLQVPSGITRKIATVWREFDDNKTPCAQFVNQLDKLQLASMAVKYEREQGKYMPDMMAYAQKGLHSPSMIRAFNDLCEQRPENVTQRPATKANPLTPAQEAAANQRAIERHDTTAVKRYAQSYYR